MARTIMFWRGQADASPVIQEFRKMGDAGQGMAQRVQQGARSIPPAMRAVDASAGVAKQKLDGLASSAGSLGQVLRTLGPMGIAAAAAIGGLGLAFTALQSSTRGAVRELGALYDNAVRMNISTDALQSYRFAMLGIGAAADAADSSLAAFSRALGQLNTDIGRRALGALEELGFTPEQIRNMGTVEQALPRIADRVRDLGDANAQAAIAQKLGLESMLPLLQRGSAAFDEAARAAREMGYTVDRELLARASEMNGLWAQASETIGVQFKAALVDLAPLFVDLATSIAGAASRLSSFLDRLRELRGELPRSERARLDRLDAVELEQAALLRRFGQDVTRFGDPRGRTDIDNPLTIGDAQSRVRLRRARNRYAALEAENAAIIEELRTSGAFDPPAARTSDPTRPAAAAIDANLQRMQQVIDRLREEAAAREELARIMADNAKLTREEAEAQRSLAADLRELDAIRAAGLITSEAELEQLQAMRRARDEETAAIRRQQQEQAALAELQRRRAELVRNLETPRERIARELRDVRAGEADGLLKPEEAARRVRMLEEEYRALAEAQYEASLQGRLLAGVIQGQVRSFDDLLRVLVSIGADSVLRELATGGLSRPGFLGRIGERMGIGGRGEEEIEEFTGAVRKSAAALLEDLAPELGNTAAKFALTTSAATAEQAATLRTVGALNTLTAAAARAAAAMGGDDETASKALRFAASFISGGGRAGGGPTFPGVRHPVAEMRPEIAVVGGWGQVAPAEALDGLALMARLARSAGAPQGPGAGPMKVAVNVVNQSGVALQAEARASVDGDTATIDLMLERRIEAKFQDGAFDDAMGRFGARPPMRNRG